MLFSNLQKDKVEEMKLEIAKFLFLKESLGLSLSLDKTKITNLDIDYAKFLGFKIKNNQLKAPVISYTKMQRTRSEEMMPVKIKQRLSWGLFYFYFLDIDHERVIFRMKLKGLLDRKGKPKRYTTVEQLKDHEIVYKFRQMLEGLFNYYIRMITFRSSLGRYHYYLVFSCLNTK